jgi:hypothetical protein
MSRAANNKTRWFTVKARPSGSNPDSTMIYEIDKFYLPP